jgi:hypothetical protein
MIPKSLEPLASNRIFAQGSGNATANVSPHAGCRDHAADLRVEQHADHFGSDRCVERLIGMGASHLPQVGNDCRAIGIEADEC